MIEKLLNTLRDPAWQGIGVILAVIFAGLPLILSPTITLFSLILCVILFGIFIYAKQNNVSFEGFYSLFQIILGFTLGGTFIVLGRALIQLQGIVILSLILVAILSRLTAHDNLKAYRPFMFSIIAGCVVLISFILNTSIPKENFPTILS